MHSANPQAPGIPTVSGSVYAISFMVQPWAYTITPPCACLLLAALTQHAHKRHLGIAVVLCHYTTTRP